VLEGFLLFLLPADGVSFSRPVRRSTLLFNHSILAQMGFVALAAFAWGILEPLLRYDLEKLDA